MLFSNYADFRAKTQAMFDGDDISQSDLSVAILDLIIGAGEQRVYREVRSSSQDAPLSVAVTSNLAALPSDFIELKQGPFVGAHIQATYAPTEAFQNVSSLDPRSLDHPVRYTFLGDALSFYPALNDGTVVSGRYYQRFPDISTGLNALFTRWPDLFLYASLSESAPFLGEMTRLPIWEGKYKEIVQSVNETERRRITRGSKLQTRLA